MNDEGLKEVYFEAWCPTCVHKDKKEEDDPCFACLNEPLNVNSHKPVRWEGK